MKQALRVSKNARWIFRLICLIAGSTVFTGCKNAETGNTGNTENLIVLNKKALKTANVSYSLNPVCKTLAVPLTEAPFRFGTGMTDPVWKKAVAADDFVRFRTSDQQPEQKSSMLLFRTRDSLVLGFFFNEPAVSRSRQQNNADGGDVWSGDMAEIHFGAMDPDPWLLQLCVGIGGGRFDSSGQYALWQSHVFETPEGWGAEIRIPVSMLRITEGGIRFNLCRQAKKRGEYATWSPLRIRFHEVENFGEILFSDYASVGSLRSGVHVKGPLSRTTFEQLRKLWEIPPQIVTHGPYLSNPDQDSICITWQTAGRIPAFLEYRIKGSKEKPVRVYCSRANGILAHDDIHFARLSELTPGIEYEYELFTLSPVVGAMQSSGIVRSFHTPSAKTLNYSFFCLSDLHSDVGFLRRSLRMPEAKNAAFHILLGDNLSHAAGREAIYEGIIDPIVTEYSAWKQDKPLAFVRGNHEQLGAYAAEYFQVMRHESGRTWYSFSYGDVFFIVLDSGDDKSDSAERVLFSNSLMMQEECRFLEKTVQSESYRKAAFRIVLMHIPPFDSGSLLSNMIRPLSETLFPPDLMLSGHWHRYARLNADATFASTTDLAVVNRVKSPVKLPFPLVVNSNTSATECRVTPEALEIKVFRPTANGEKAEIIDSFRIPRRTDRR